MPVIGFSQDVSFCTAKFSTSILNIYYFQLSIILFSKKIADGPVKTILYFLRLDIFFWFFIQIELEILKLWKDISEEWLLFEIHGLFSYYLPQTYQVLLFRRIQQVGFLFKDFCHSCIWSILLSETKMAHNGIHLRKPKLC